MDSLLAIIATVARQRCRSLPRTKDATLTRGHRNRRAFQRDQKERAADGKPGEDLLDRRRVLDGLEHELRAPERIERRARVDRRPVDVLVRTERVSHLLLRRPGRERNDAVTHRARDLECEMAEAADRPQNENRVYGSECLLEGVWGYPYPMPCTATRAGSLTFMLRRESAIFVQITRFLLYAWKERTEAGDACTQQRRRLSRVHVFRDSNDCLRPEDDILGVPAIAVNTY